MDHEKIVSHRSHLKRGMKTTPSPKKKLRLEDVSDSIYRKEIGKISDLSDKMSEEINKHQEKIKDAKKGNNVKATENQKQRKTILDLESSQDELQKEFEKIKTKTAQIYSEMKEKEKALTKELEVVKNKNKVLERKLEEMKKEVDSLRKEVDSLRKEVEDSKCKKARLALGQIAWLLEAEIWKVVLPDENMGYTGILRSMRHWLKTNKSTKDGKAAQKRWKDLKKELSWDEKYHNHALKCLKDLRVEDAHPVEVNLKEAKDQLNDGNYVADTDKEVCNDIIDMLKKARELNTSK